ncbi:MAG: CoA transferase, partial [Henriciella sp.]
MLEGIRVIEHATYMAAPGAGGILSDWGADVIKI